MSRRTEMLGSTIRKELMGMVMRDLHDPRLTGMPTITRVKVTEDLEFADVYITVMGTPGQQSAALNALKHSAGVLRGKLTKLLSVRHTPFLRFQMDEGLKKELEILDLLDKVRQENEDLDRQRAEAATAAGGEGTPGKQGGEGPQSAPEQSS